LVLQHGLRLLRRSFHFHLKRLLGLLLLLLLQAQFRLLVGVLILKLLLFALRVLLLLLPARGHLLLRLRSALVGLNRLLLETLTAQRNLRTTSCGLTEVTRRNVQPRRDLVLCHDQMNPASPGKM
jgi:hypothetical protein